MLELKNIKKNYGKYTALEHIDFTFTNGIYGLLAPNGAGKTTLMKLITTLNFPTEGEITYNGSHITHLGSKYRDLIGYLPQDFGYYPHYTAIKFLKYMAAIKGYPKIKVEERISELLEMVGLSHVKHKKLSKYSGGMLQRIGIAQALLNDPKLLILDEPTAGLDPKERVRFRQMLASLGKNRIVIISTHIVSDVESIAKEIVFIKNKTIFKAQPIFSIIEELDGKVWTVQLNDKEATALEEQYLIVNKNIMNKVYELRVISDHKPHEQALNVNANLEDVFIYHYGQDLIL